MKNKIAQSEIEARFAQINAMEPEEPSGEDIAAISAAQADGFASATDLEEYRASLEDFSGKLVLRIPRSLHKTLKAEAEIEGVSLNQYMLYKLAR